MDSTAVTAVAAVVSALTTGCLVVITWLYALETRRYREIAAGTLTQLKAAHEKSYEAYVVAGHWNRDSEELEIHNIGPGPAEFISIRAVLLQPGDRPVFYQGFWPGLAVGQSAPVKLRNAEPFDRTPEEGTIVFELTTKTTLGGEMPSHWFSLAIPPFPGIRVLG